MVLGLEFCVDPLFFVSNMHMVCVALYISFPKCPRSSKSEFGAKRYGHFSVDHSVTGRWTGRESGQHLRVRSVFLTRPSAIERTESPVIKRALWNLSGSDWTLTLGESSSVT